MDKKIIAVDFDGTLAVTEYPKIIEPIEPAIDYIKQCKAEGNIIILDTCRHDIELANAVKWCKEQGIEFDYVNENVSELIEKLGDCRKIFADEYIDDKAINVGEICFNYQLKNLYHDTPKWRSFKDYKAEFIKE